MARKIGTKNDARRMDVFVSVGTHPQQFDRLLAEIDSLAGKGILRGEIFAQSGYSSYEPGNFRWKKFLTLEEFASALKGCSVFITHAGEGNIGQAKNLGKKMIVAPRRKEFGEHTNDHQLELARVVADKKIGIVAWRPAELEKKLAELGEFRPAKIPKGNIARIIEKFVRKEFA